MDVLKETDLIKGHLSENESISNMALGGLHRPYVPFIAWAPLWIMVILRVAGVIFGALWWLGALAFAIVMNIFLNKRYLITVTNERLHMIGLKRFKLAEKAHRSWLLADVHSYELREKKAAVVFKLHTAVKEWTLSFGTKKSATEIYNKLQINTN